jgi:hypothetical protein
MKHVGILAHSADGAALCFLEMVRESARSLGRRRVGLLGTRCDAAPPEWRGGPFG